MTKLLPFLGIILLVAIGLLFIPLGATAALVIKAVAAILAILVVLSGFAVGKTATAPKVEQPAKPAPTTGSKGSAEAEVITLLSRLQEKGRLIDFLMDDISAHDDASVGAVARVVYQGCKEVLDEHFDVTPIETGNEGSNVDVPEGYDASLYRLTGNLGGSAPFKGTLVHKGWKVTSAKLPKVIASKKGKLPPLAPAQVEV